MMKTVHPILLILIFFFCQCTDINKDAEKFKTKEEFKHRYKHYKSNYHLDSLSFVREFRRMIDADLSPYSSYIYDDKTKIVVDTIIYSPDGEYVSVMVVMKCFNGSYKYLSENDDPKGWTFNGTYFFAERSIDTTNSRPRWRIYDYNRIEHINGDSYQKISNLIRLDNLSGRSYYANKNNYEAYNVDDYRFWSSKEFKRIQEEGFIKIHR